MADKIKQDIRQLDDTQLGERLKELRHTLFGLKLNATTTQIKDYSQFKKLRCAIAQAETIKRQRQGIVHES